MGKAHATLVKVYYDGYDFSSKHNKIDLTIGRVELIRNVFGQVGVGRQTGLREFEFSHEGYIERGATAVEHILFNNIGVGDKIFTVCQTTGAEGQPAYSSKGIGLSYVPTHRIGELQGFVGAAYNQGDHIVRGTVMATGAKASSTVGTAWQFSPAAYDTQQGNLSYTTENSDKTFTDDAQDFADWESATPNAVYLIMITNDDTTVTWGYLGAKVSATEVKVYQDITLVTTGWNGQDPSAKTPLTYEIWTAARYLYALMHVTAVSGTSPTLDMVINSDEAVEMGSATPRFTFAQKTTIGSQWMTPISASMIDTYFQASWTIGGTDSPSFTVAVILAMQ